MNFVLSSLSEGLLWSIMAIGVYLTFRILDIADLTAEGSFPLGTDPGRAQSLACNSLSVWSWDAGWVGFRDSSYKNENSSPLDRDCHFDRTLLHQYQNHGWGTQPLYWGCKYYFQECDAFGSFKWRICFSDQYLLLDHRMSCIDLVDEDPTRLGPSFNWR